ncbi:MAG: hypothetical protein WC805_01285 [Patescibacteria group bacterium]|jgi:hypothetical protein
MADKISPKPMPAFYRNFLDQFHRERHTSKFYTTQSFKRLWNSFLDYVKTQEFQDDVQKIRNDLGIPKNGFQIEGDTWSHYPENWRYGSEERTKFSKQIKELCEKLDLIPLRDWRWIIETYALYNQAFLCIDPNSHNLCYVTDLATHKDSLGNELTTDLTKMYPIALLISPHASKRDILDYIEKLYSTEIEPAQEKHKGGSRWIKPVRKKRQRQRNDFIYDNKNLPLAKIADIVQEKFGGDLMDEGAVSKIISLESKKRS